MNNLPKDLFGDDSDLPSSTPQKPIVSSSEEKVTMLQRQTQLALDPLFSDQPAGKKNLENMEKETQIANRYKVIKVLGKGGMGIVYKVFDQQLKHELALKMLLPQQTSIEATQRFFQEARSMAKLRHENIVAVHDIGEHKGNPFFTMDLVPGKDLPDCLENTKLRQAMEWMNKICLAIHYIHEQGLIHRDLKPSNVMIANNNPVLMDFGIAKDKESEAQLTMEGRSIGTPAYMAPEQARGKVSEIDQRTDVYGLGAILYEILTRNPPFSGTPMQVIFKVCGSDPKSVREYNPNLPNDLVAIVEKAMSKDKKFRYSNAMEMAQDLQRYLEGVKVQAQPIPPLLKWWRNARRNPRFVYGSVACIVIFFLGIFGIWFMQNQSNADIDNQIQELLSKASEEQGQINGQTPLSSYWRICDYYTQVLTMDSENNIARQNKFETILKIANKAYSSHNYDLARAMLQLALSMEMNPDLVKEEIQKLNQLEQEEKEALQKKMENIFQKLSNS